VLTMRISEPINASCRHCGSSQLRRLMSRFATPKSEEARLEALADPARYADLDENDPRSIARMMRKIGQEMGEDVQGPEFDEAIEELERGGEESEHDEGLGASGEEDL